MYLFVVQQLGLDILLVWAVPVMTSLDAPTSSPLDSSASRSCSALGFLAPLPLVHNPSAAPGWRPPGSRRCWLVLGSLPGCCWLRHAQCNGPRRAACSGCAAQRPAPLRHACWIHCSRSSRCCSEEAQRWDRSGSSSGRSRSDFVAPPRPLWLLAEPPQPWRAHFSCDRYTILSFRCLFRRLP